jgi:hypothetical protein
MAVARAVEAWPVASSMGPGTILPHAQAGL